jgi:CBS domain-containing protein
MSGAKEHIMKFDDLIRSVLERKGRDIISLPLDASVYSALSLMADHDIGALLVTGHDGPAGIFSERDYARKVILLGRSSMETSVREVMSTPVCVAPTDTVDSCLHLMTTMRVRHLLVMDGQKTEGLISVGDLVNWMITVQAETIDHLRSYVSSGYPG